MARVAHLGAEQAMRSAAQRHPILAPTVTARLNQAPQGLGSTRQPSWGAGPAGSRGAFGHVQLEVNCECVSTGVCAGCVGCVSQLCLAAEQPVGWQHRWRCGAWGSELLNTWCLRPSHLHWITSRDEHNGVHRLPNMLQYACGHVKAKLACLYSGCC